MLDPSDSEQVLKRQSAELAAMTENNLRQLQSMLDEQAKRSQQLENYEHSLTAVAKVEIPQMQMPNFEMPAAPTMPNPSMPQITPPVQQVVESKPMPSGLPPIPQNLPPSPQLQQSWQMPRKSQEADEEPIEYIEEGDGKESSISAYHIIVGILIIIFFLRCS